MPKLVVLDGNSLLYRGFFAMRSLTTSDGTPTNAVYSFVNMVWTIIEREKPDLIFAAFDPPAPTFRHAELPSYKGNRLAIPDDLRPQRKLARDACRAFNIPVIEVVGFEADDVCGTLAEQAKALGYECVIVTGDGDALQLVDDGHGPVRVVITVKGVTDTVTYDEAAVDARYGLTPAQIPDLKALKGDSSDNLPGIPGVGDKSAAKWLQEFHTVEELLQHLDAVPDRLRPAFEASKDQILQWKHLTTIVRDVPLPEWVAYTDTYQTTGPNFAEVRALFDQLEFRTLSKRLPTLQAAFATGKEPDATDKPESVRTHTNETALLPDAAAFDAFVATLPTDALLGLCPLYEDATKDAAALRLHGCAIGVSGKAAYISYAAGGDTLTAFLTHNWHRCVVHDSKRAAEALMNAGGWAGTAQHDTLLAGYLLNPGRSSYNAADLISDQLGTLLLADASDPEGVAMDTAALLPDLADKLAARLEADGLTHIYKSIELPLSPLLAQVERHGVTVDRDVLAQVSEHLGARLQELEADIYQLAGQEFSIGSTKQLQEILFVKLGLPSGKKTKTGFSTGADVLEDLAANGHEIGAKVLEWRELNKLKSTYADSLQTLINPDTGRIHTSLNQTVASTGRLSSSNPNLQNIPIRTEAGREIRKAFVASPGRVLVSADYSQIELRFFAHFTADVELLRAFQSEEDIHAGTARLIFGIPEGEAVSSDQRRQAKTINFAVLYGAGPFRVAAELGISQSRASELIKLYLAQYPGVRAFLDGILDGARSSGYVQTPLGRRRYIPDLHSRVFQFRQAAEREAMNMPIQGASADLIKVAMLNVEKAIQQHGVHAEMVLQVHDELLFECAPEDVNALSKLVRHEMETAMTLAVPIRAEVKSGHNWWDVTPVSELADSDAGEAGA